MSHSLDHLIYAAPDLDAAVARFEAIAGVKLGVGGVHPGLGTQNALIALDHGSYFEVLGPDPSQELEGTYGGLFAEMERAGLWGYMLKASHFQPILTVLHRHGIDAEIVEASRNTVAGETLTWRLLLPQSNPLGEFVPKFIDWADNPHPAQSAPHGCRLVAFEIGHPEAARLTALLGDLDVDLTVHRADRPTMMARLATPSGSVLLTGP